jgi:hypothetical protein
MGDRVYFATFEADVTRSSGFNGFSVPVIEVDSEGNPFTMWDGDTFVQPYEFEYYTPPGNSLGIGTSRPIGFSLEKMVELFWRRKYFFKGSGTLNNNDGWGQTTSQTHRRGWEDEPPTERHICTGVGGALGSVRAELISNVYTYPPDVSQELKDEFESYGGVGSFWAYISFYNIVKHENLYYPVLGAGYYKSSWSNGYWSVYDSLATKVSDLDLNHGGDISIDGTTLPVYADYLQNWPNQWGGPLAIEASFSTSPSEFPSGTDVFYPYKNKDGNAVWDTRTGVQINSLY